MWNRSNKSIWEGATNWTPSAFCILNIKRAVNSVFTHGSFHWIKARGCCVSLDSHHYAWWILMSGVHWGDMLRRTRLANVFSTVSALSITLTICLPAGVHQHVHARTHTHKHTWINAHKEHRKCMHTHTFLFHTGWQRCSRLECYHLNVTCKLIIVVGVVREIQGDYFSRWWFICQMWSPNPHIVYCSANCWLGPPLEVCIKLFLSYRSCRISDP